MKRFFIPLILIAMSACNPSPDTKTGKEGNPFFAPLNQPVQYSEVTRDHIRDYAQLTLREVDEILEGIRTAKEPGFNNIFVEFDGAINSLSKAANNCFMFYWVSPDSLSRERGLEGYQKLDSLSNSLSSDATLFRQMQAFKESAAYGELTGHRKRFVDDVILTFEHSGVNLEAEALEQFRALKSEISELSSRYSMNMNTANAVLELDEQGAEGIPQGILEGYLREDGTYGIPVIPATRQPVLNNAIREETRKSFYVKYLNRGYEKNLDILAQLVDKRHQLAGLMDYPTYAAYATSMKMSKTPEAVWGFLEDLIDRSGTKAKADLEKLRHFRNRKSGILSDEPVSPWDEGYYRNQLLLEEFHVDQELIREYLPMEQCLSGMLDIFSELLGVEYRRVQEPSVWHEDVILYEVLEKGEVTGRFYLDLYPRPNKESWFYGVQINYGRLTPQGQEIPTCLLLANFTPATENRPAMVSHDELSTLFHEFGHIMDNMSYTGEFSWQANSKEDFAEAMSQIFENWIWDYDMLSRFAHHYQTGEVLPRATFDNMLKAKNVTSGLDAMRSLRNSVYDMLLYDRFDPATVFDSDQLWRTTDQITGIPNYVEGTHGQGSWIHINTHPNYYYGYLWAEVYAQDMFTVFEEKGLTNTEAGVRYRHLILANGTQRDINEAVEEFLGRPSNNEAYIKSLGL